MSGRDGTLGTVGLPAQVQGLYSPVFSPHFIDLLSTKFAFYDHLHFVMKKFLHLKILLILIIARKTPPISDGGW